MTAPFELLLATKYDQGREDVALESGNESAVAFLKSRGARTSAQQRSGL